MTRRPLFYVTPRLVPILQDKSRLMSQLSWAPNSAPNQVFFSYATLAMHIVFGQKNISAPWVLFTSRKSQIFQWVPNMVIVCIFYLA